VNRAQRRVGPIRVRLGLSLAFLTGLLSVAVALENPPGPTAALPQPSLERLAPAFPLANFGMPERLPTVPERAPRPATGVGSVAEFVDNLSHNDAAFEVMVGQSRILTTKTDLAVRGKPSALVAVGDPTVADFQVLSVRQIRIGGQRLGVTDLSIITPDTRRTASRCGACPT